MRDIVFLPDFIEKPFSSVLVSAGKTRVLTTVSMQQKTPPYVEKGKGWLTAEYAMLPGSTDSRVNRERNKVGGRTAEIQRLIGRSLRMAVDRSLMPGITLITDADVIQADGGTRTTSINGAMLALKMAGKRLVEEEILEQNPVTRWIGAISAGIVEGELIVDLDYEKDFRAEADFNFVFAEDGRIIEIQGTAESEPVAEKDFLKLLENSRSSAMQIIGKMKEVYEEL